MLNRLRLLPLVVVIFLSALPLSGTLFQRHESSKQLHVVVGVSDAVKLRYADISIYYLTQQVNDTQNQLDTVKADRDAKAAENVDLKQQVKALTLARYTPASYSVGVGSPCVPQWTDHFPWGYCTWYVGCRRSIPWFGDAKTWLAQAASKGFSTGGSPTVGAIMVSNESWFGHVALVDAVGAGWFTVSEMNWSCFGCVDVRTIKPGTVSIQGFIY